MSERMRRAWHLVRLILASWLLQIWIEVCPRAAISPEMAQAIDDWAARQIDEAERDRHAA